MKYVLSSFLILFTNSVSVNVDDLPINKIQIIGSHNSYKQSIDPTLFHLIQQTDSAVASQIDYSHISLSEQLSLGLCNLEIDVYADEKGGKYAHPKGLEWGGEESRKIPYDPQGLMNEPGFKVFHIQDIDFRSNCLTFKQCLQELRSWSDQHKDHYPIFITMNAKDEVINRPGFTVPEKFTSNVFDELDRSILENLGGQYLITPDMVRGKFKSLEEAVLHNNWPTLKAARGKFIFILDENGDKRTAYIQNHPGLQGRVLFADAVPGTPEAAILIMNDPKKEGLKIQEMVRKGYIVRTRADADTWEARKNDRTRFEAACQSGSQIITTDYYVKSTHFDSDYSISFEDGKYFRVNPLIGAKQ